MVDWVLELIGSGDTLLNVDLGEIKVNLVYSKEL